MMNKHPFLRAYLAGICVPTIFLLVVATGFTLMAVVPNVWGLWNIFFAAFHERLHLSLGLHGAFLPILLAPLGMIAAGLLKFSIPSFASHVFPFAAPFALIIYYLAWKYLVGSLNAELGIA